MFDLRDGDTKTVRNLLAYRKVSAEGDTEAKLAQRAKKVKLHLKPLLHKVFSNLT